MSELESKPEIKDKNKEDLNKYNDVILYFPDSISTESLQKKFILSLNDARQSDFLKVLLDNISSDNDDIIDENKIIKIPSGLYKGLRYVDLCHFIDLWKGKELFFHHNVNENKYNFKSILNVCDSLALNEELSFIKNLRKIYMKNIEK